MPNIKKNMKSWHIWDFPDNIYVLIKSNVHEEFFNYVFKKFGGKRPYARFLNTSQMHVKKCWKRYFIKNNKKYVQYTTAWFLKKSYPILNKRLIKDIENGVEYFRVRAGKPTKVSLPIKECPKLYRIVAHLLADGFAGKKKVPYYSNNCKMLREQFKKDLRVFGNLYVYERKPNTTWCVFFPKVVSNVLRHIFDIEFTRPTNIPKFIFNSTKSCKSAFLQALYDDEGTVSGYPIIGMKNYNIMNEIRLLVENMGVKTNRINGCGNRCRYFSIESRNIKKFKEKIDFSHPIKRHRLKVILKVQRRNKTKRTRPLDWTRGKILKLLNKKPMSTFQISEKILLGISGAHSHLRWLEKNNKIIKDGPQNKVFWKIKA